MKTVTYIVQYKAGNKTYDTYTAVSCKNYMKWKMVEDLSEHSKKTGQVILKGQHNNMRITCM